MTFEQATLADLQAFLLGALAPRLTVPRRLYRHLIAEVACGTAWVVRRTPEEPPLAIGGVYRFDDGRPGQAWLICVPAFRAHVAGVAGRARAALRAAREAGPIVAVVRTQAGGRMARALGFAPVDGGPVWRM